MLRVPFYKPSLGREEVDEVVDTLQSGWLTTGPTTKQFEQEKAEYRNQPTLPQDWGTKGPRTPDRQAEVGSQRSMMTASHVRIV